MSENKMKKILEKFKSLFIKQDFLRESIEDAMADVIDKAEDNETLQAGEEKLLQVGIKAGVTFIQSQTGSSIHLTDEQYAQISKSIMEAKAKFMPILENQLRKKSKTYQENISKK